MGDGVMDIQALSFSYGPHPVLQDITLPIQKESCWGIVGPNGAGKSTFLKCLNRLLDTFEGTVLLEGRDTRNLSRKALARRIAYVPQAGSEEPPPFTVKEFVLMARYPYMNAFRSYQAEDQSAVRNAMARADVTDLAERPLNGLSGGERQKVYIAAALAQETDILLLDEPTTFLDYRHQAEVLALIRQINQAGGATVLAVMHDVNAALQVADHVLALKDGRQVLSGGRDLLCDPGNLAAIFDMPFRVLPQPGKAAPLILPGSEPS